LIASVSLSIAYWRRLQRHPALRIVFEHITTAQAAQFVSEAGPNVGATITAHHLLYNRNAIFRRHPPASLLPAG
jgi:dihydroorotase